MAEKNRWRRIRKQFLSGIVRFIPKDEAHEIFDILEEYEAALEEIKNMTADSPDFLHKALHNVCAQVLKEKNEPDRKHRCTSTGGTEYEYD